MTPLFQPADVCWMSSLKSDLFKRWNNCLIHAPKAYTASGKQLDPLLIGSSFNKCGIILRNLADYSSQLRHFVRTNMFVDDVVPIYDQISDQTNELQGDEWDPAL